MLCSPQKEMCLPVCPSYKPVLHVTVKISPVSGHCNAPSLQKPTIDVSNPEIHWNIYIRNYFSVSKITVLKSLFIKFASNSASGGKFRHFIGFQNSPRTLEKTEINGLLAFQEPIAEIIRGFSKKLTQNSKSLVNK